MDRFEEGYEKLQEFKGEVKEITGEVKDRIKAGDINYSFGYYHEDILLI